MGRHGTNFLERASVMKMNLHYHSPFLLKAKTKKEPNKLRLLEIILTLRNPAVI